ncbi:MAG: hypothetical protein PHV30_00450 [Candidatus Margulisbacteria bacterium]|nr:hypothetical protein [Candidatus Margulisiibacteriota bacterium]
MEKTKEEVLKKMFEEAVKIDKPIYSPISVVLTIENKQFMLLFSNN